MSAVLLFHPAALCWRAAYAEAAKRGVSAEVAELAARDTWRDYSMYTVPPGHWANLVGYAFDRAPGAQLAWGLVFDGPTGAGPLGLDSLTK